MKMFLQSLKISVLLTLMTGFLYPLIVLGIANFIFPKKAQGSLLRQDDKVIGSKLIGQKFSQKKYFWGRPSAVDYRTLPAGGSNLGPTSAKLKKQIQERRLIIAEAHGIQDFSIIPIELITASASGVDPHISFDAAYFQLERVAKERSMNDEKSKFLIEKMIHKSINKPMGKLFGVAHINVLMLNLALDNYEKNHLKDELSK